MKFSGIGYLCVRHEVANKYPWNIAEMIQPIYDEEIITALRSIGANKAPGVNGFNAKFLSTHGVGHEVKEAYNISLEKKKMYPAINCTLVALIPKVKKASKMREMRPVSCCTTIYKIILKILTIRLGKVISPMLISRRTIHDNIFMTHELMRGYDRKYISPQCIIQMDLQKAYDTVKWIALGG